LAQSCRSLTALSSENDNLGNATARRIKDSGATLQLSQTAVFGTTHYAYDRAGGLLVEATGTGTTQREYVWLDDTPLVLFANLDTGSPQQWYVHPDHLDRPTKMTDASQAVVWDSWHGRGCISRQQVLRSTGAARQRP
jgi:hypothetical protein